MHIFKIQDMYTNDPKALKYFVFFMKQFLKLFELNFYTLSWSNPIRVHFGLFYYLVLSLCIVTFALVVIMSEKY